MIADDERGVEWTEKLSPWLLVFMLAGFTMFRWMTQPTEPAPQILSLNDLRVDQLQLIPHIGPVLADELKNLQGHDLRSCRGIGASREQMLRRYLITSPPTKP